MKRYITYDISNEESYNKLYEYFEKTKAKMISKSTYLINDNIDWKSFKDKIRELTTEGDSISIIFNSVNGISDVKIRWKDGRSN